MFLDFLDLLEFPLDAPVDHQHPALLVANKTLVLDFASSDMVNELVEIEDGLMVAIDSSAWLLDELPTLV